MLTTLTKSHQLVQLLEVEISQGRLSAGTAVPSQNELARVHGVSVATVRDAFSALEHRGMIRRVQGKGTFVCQAGAGGARSDAGVGRQRGHSIGLVTGCVEHPSYAELAAAIEGAARVAGLSLLVNMHSRDALDKREALGRLNSETLEAIALGPINDQKEWDFITHGKLPRHAITFRCMSPIDAHYVTTDRAAGIVAAMEHLHGLGHRRIALLTGEKKVFVWGRITGFREALRKLNLNERQCPVIHCPNASMQSGGHQAAREVLSGSGTPRPTALLMHNDLAAMGALQAAREAGLRVPRDLSVVGFDDIQMAAYAAVPLTTIDLKTAEIGQAVIQILSELLSGESRDPHDLTLRQIVLQPELIVRDSTTAPPMSAAARSRKTRKGTQLVGS